MPLNQSIHWRGSAAEATAATWDRWRVGLRRCAGARERWSASPMASLVAPAKHPEILPKNVSVPWRCVLRRHRLIEGDDRFANAFTWAYPERARQDLGRLQVAFGACGGANGAETLKFPLGSHRPIRNRLGKQRPRPRSTGLLLFARSGVLRNITTLALSFLCRSASVNWKRPTAMPFTAEPAQQRPTSRTARR